MEVLKMATVCIDPNCKPHMRGEVVPVVVEVTSETDTIFQIIDNPLRTFCEIKTASGESVISLPVSIKVISNTKKQVFSSWDTSKLDVGYYILRFWISINIFGIVDDEDNLIEDYRLASPEIKRYIKAD
jgi:hypothetical protein